MIFDPASAQALKPWLVRTLEPICDAEPGALADYILALLKHNVPESEMRKELAVQLDEFLENECSNFINTLFTVLRTKSYLPYGPAESSSAPAAKQPDGGIPIPLDGLLAPPPSSPESSSRKRSIENDERDGRPPAKGPRLNNDSQFSRYGNGEGRSDFRSSGGWEGRGERPQNEGYRDARTNGYAGPMSNMGVMQGMNGIGNGMAVGMGQLNGRRQPAYHPPDQKRGICRDYHNNGYCARGAMCRFSHGEDAVIPGQLYPMNGAVMPFMPMFSPAVGPFGVTPGAAYDPHEARMDMRPGRLSQRVPLLPRVQKEDGSGVAHPVDASGELPVIQDLTPDVSNNTPTTGSPQTKMQPLHPGTRNSPQPQFPVSQIDSFEMNGYGMMPMNGLNGQQYMPMASQADVEMAPPNAESIRPHRGNFRGGRGGVARGRGGIFPGEVHNFRPEKRNDKTLVVEKIPEDKLSLDQVNAWFKRFGTVTNVAIDAVGAKALVSFSEHEEAHAAWKSEDAVFNNRFVKVFWHRPMAGHGEVGQRMLAASAPLVANIAGKEPVPPSSTPVVTIPTATPRKSTRTTSATSTSLAAKQELLEKQIAEQKSLMASLSTASPEEKKTIMARLRKLGEEMKAPLAPTPSSASPVDSAVKKPAANPEDHERSERERLDKELEMHSAAIPQVDEGTEDLKAKLERLKAEAASLGIAEAAAETTSYSGSYRGYRARGRGARSFYRGAVRGGPPARSMKLDNRPKKLLLKGVSSNGVQAVHDWYESTGLLDSVELSDSGDVIASFKSRAAAEQGLAKGSNIPNIGTIQIIWYSGKGTDNVSPSPTIANTTKTPSTVAALTDAQDTVPERPRSPELPIAHSLEEEEIIASGWGGGDDEDGMGML